MNLLRILRFVWLLCGALACQVGLSEPFKDGDRVAFVGDSVTHQGRYTSCLRLYYYTRFPSADIRLWNFGVGGAWMSELEDVAHNDVSEFGPTHVSVLAGMNDVGVDYYVPQPTPRQVELRKSRLNSFQSALPSIRKALAASAPKGQVGSDTTGVVGLVGLSCA